MIEVYVTGLAFDTMTSSPVVLLKKRQGERVLPIWIGVNEASVIAMELSGVTYKRPLTHDLLKAVLTGFSADVQKVVVSSLEDNTFYAKLYIVAPGNSLFEIDARPSDSIAMALKMKSQIFVSSDLDDSFVELTIESPEDSTDGDSIDTLDLGSRLRNIRPEDFGHFNL
jgi:uncharacterized protein